MKIQDLLLALIVALIWGLSSSVAKIGIVDIPPFLLMGIRFSLSSLFVIPFLSKPQISLIKLSYLTILWVGYHGLAILVIKRGLAISTLVILQESSVPITALLSYIILGERIKKGQMLGIILSFVGAIIIFGSPTIQGDMITIIILFSSVLSWVLYNITKKSIIDFKVFNIWPWVIVVSSPIFLSLSYIFEQPSLGLFVNISITSLFSIIYLSLFSTLIAFSIWLYLLKHYTATLIAPILLLKVIIGVFSGIILFNEPINSRIVIGSIIILTGMAMIMKLLDRKPINI